MAKPGRQALTRYQLAELVGPTIAATIIGRFGGRQIPRPTDLHDRHERIRDDLEHDSYEVVAQRHGLSVSQVVRIGKRPSMPARRSN